MCVLCVCSFGGGGGNLKDSGFRNDCLMPGSIKFKMTVFGDCLEMSTGDCKYDFFF